jgi:hypothetical protein
VAELRFERELRDALAMELESVHGPHPRWAGSPAARRVTSAAGSRRPFVALAAVAAAVVVAVMVSVVGLPWANQVAAPTAPPTPAPWPSSVPPDAPPTTGTLPLGQVAIVTMGGTPALAVRVSADPAYHGGDVGLLVEVRVVGPVPNAFGARRFVNVRGGRKEAPGLGITGHDPLEIPAGAALGTQATAAIVVAFGSRESVDLGVIGADPYLAFTYAVHRPAPAVVPPVVPGHCPTLADYAAASAAPSESPVPPSFDHLVPGTPPTVGDIPLGQVGVVDLPSAPGTGADALVRVSNARFCDRLPDDRADEYMNEGATFLLADVEIQVLAGELPSGFIPSGDTFIAATYGGYRTLDGRPDLWFPGVNQTSTLTAGAGWSYRGTFIFLVPPGPGEVAIGVYPDGPHVSTNGRIVQQFRYVVRPGTVSGWPTAAPIPSGPSRSPASGTVPTDTPVVVGVGPTRVSVTAGAVQQVAGYTDLVPVRPGDAFVETRLGLGPATGDYTFDPAAWAIRGPDGGVVAPLAFSEQPRFSGPLMPTAPALFALDNSLPRVFFVIVEVPATGRVTLEYRPNGGPAQVTWVLRDH